MDPTAYKNIKSRIELAHQELQCCRLCPLQCQVDRTAGETGACGLTDLAVCFREMVNCGEEDGLNPSHQVYFAGCNLKCEYCTVAEWNEKPCEIRAIDDEMLIERIANRKEKGAKTLNLLGGEPSISVYGILKLLEKIDPTTCVVWNSNMYYNEVVDDMIEGLVDICLADLKCASSECSKALLGASDYFKIARDSILRANEHSDVIVRHLVMPGHLECCLKPTLNWLKKELPSIRLSLRTNYIPPAESTHAPAGYLEEDEASKAFVLAKESGLKLIV